MLSQFTVIVRRVRDAIGIASFFDAEEPQTSPVSKSQDEGRQTDFRLPVAWRRPDVLLASLFINLLSLALPIVILQIYDRIIPNSALSTFSVLIAFVCLALVGEVVLRILRATILSAAGARYEHRTSLSALSAVLGSDYAEYIKQTAGSYADKLSGLQQVRDFYAGQVATLAIDIPFIVIFLTLIWLIGGYLVLVPLSLIAVLVFVVYALGEKLTDALKARQQTDRRRYDFLIETLQGAHTVKALAMERLMVRRYERLQSQSSGSVVNLSELHSFCASIANSFSQLGMVLYVAAGALLVVNQSMTLGGLAAGTMLTGRALQPILRGLNFWTRLQSVLVAQTSMEEVFELKAAEGATLNEAPKFRGEIEFKNVSFQYEPDDPPIVKNVSLQIPAGAMIGITGQNGCGTTTLLSLLNGIQKPTSGQVLIDGQNISAYEGSSVRGQIGYMPEKGVLFNGTLLENLTMFREGEAKLRAVEVIRLLGMEEFVVRLPQGLDTPMGGSVMATLPAGIQQRIVIARALVSEPPIVLFDNAHNGLDLESDEQLRQAFLQLRGKKTIILATYRPSFLKICDEVYTLAEGRLVNQNEESDGAAQLSRSDFEQFRELAAKLEHAVGPADPEKKIS